MNERKEYFAKYYLENKERITVRNEKWRKENLDKKRAYNRKFMRKYVRRPEIMEKERIRGRKRIQSGERPFYMKSYHQRMRQIVIEGYGGACTCCGEARREFLSLEHIRGKIDKISPVTGKLKNPIVMLREVISEGFPVEKYTILCYNCNMSRGFLGYCPHEREKQKALQVVS